MSLTVPVNELIEKSSDPLLQIHTSWERIPLSYVADILNGFAFKSVNFSQIKGFPLLRIRDVGKNNVETLYDGEFDSAFIVNHGDLIVGMDGDFRSSIWNGPKALLNQRVCKIIPITENYDFKFLDLVLPAYLKAINEKTSAVTVKHLSSKSISEILLPLPPLLEQHRIVQKVEELFTDLDAGVQDLEKAKIQIKNYRQAVLKAAFEGELTKNLRELNLVKAESASILVEKILREQKKLGKKLEDYELAESNLPRIPVTWVWVAIGNLFEVKPGGTPSRKEPEYWNGNIPWVSSGEVANCIINETQELITQLGVENSNAKTNAPGTVLLAMIGEGKTRGQVAILNIEAATNQNVAAIRCASTSILPKYVFFWLQSRYEINRTRGFGGMQQALNARIIKEMPIPIPPIEEQKVIVSETERRFSVIDQIEKIIDQSLIQAEKLRQSILKKAFEGKLVPQNASDESASILLKKVKTEKSNLAASNRIKRKPTSKLKTKEMGKMKNSEADIQNADLYKILSSSNSRSLTPKKLWQLSKLDIEDFYERLKVEVENGRIVERRPNDIDVYLEIHE